MMFEQQPPPPSRIVDRILGSRYDRHFGEAEPLQEGEHDYEAYTLTQGFPQMGFTLLVYQRIGNGFTEHSHGILFHDIKKPKWKRFEGTEMVSFICSGEAFTLSGKKLYPMYQALINGTVQQAIEFEPKVFKSPPMDGPIIEQVLVTDVQEMVRRSREDRENRRGN